VIGGLVKTDEVLVKSGVPLLQDIPLLGNVFKHSSKQTMNQDLLVFITPTIVEGPRQPFSLRRRSMCRKERRKRLRPSQWSNQELAHALGP
jgi:general secretion pathway protein D